jgi:predicted RNase H-like nuclease
LIEVYPHPALVELCDEPQRLPYKVGKLRSYWPDASQAEAPAAVAIRRMEFDRHGA